jgi:RsiW-degrading membrane proteinase PrsW (M82 family)
MQVATTDPVDIVFDLFFPPIGALIVFGGAYAVARAVAGGRPVSQLTKTILWFSSLLALGIGYDMGLTKLLGFSPETLLVTLPIWALTLIVLMRRRYLTKRQNQEAAGSSSM